MKRFEAETKIDRPAEVVWAYAADIKRHGEWMEVTDARALDGDGTQVGARGQERIGFGPVRWHAIVEVTVAEPARRLRWRSVSSRVEVEVGLELEPEGPSAVRARYEGTIRLRGGWRLLEPLLAVEGAQNIRRELEQLKARVEAAPAPALATAS